MPNIKLKGQIIEYSIRESKRAKRITIRIVPNKGLELVYPAGVKKPTPKELLKQNQAWVLSTLDKVQERVEAQFQRDYQQGEIFQYLGKDVTLDITQKTHGTTMTIQLMDDKLTVTLPPDIDINDTDAIRYAVESFYRRQAKWYLIKQTQKIADILGLKVNRVFIKNQKTKWGSCSSNNNINLNLRLMMAEPEAIDYIIIHELCHLVHMNHSKQFWNLVGNYCPKYKYWRRWFKENGQFLIL